MIDIRVRVQISLLNMLFLFLSHFSYYNKHSLLIFIAKIKGK